MEEMNNVAHRWGFTGSLVENIWWFIAFVILVALVTYLCANPLANLTRRVGQLMLRRIINEQIADALLMAMGPSLRWFWLLVVPGVILTTAGSGATDERWWVGVAWNCGTSLITLALGSVLYGSVNAINIVVEQRSQTSLKALSGLIVRFLQMLVAVCLIFVILGYWGINLTPIIAGAGLFGIALALGAQDLFKNFISGILLVLEKRFHIGDFVSIPGKFDGIIESIGLRSSIVVHLDRTKSFVPNALLSDEALVNLSLRDHRQINWVVGVEYSTPPEKIQALIKDITAYIQEHEDFAVHTARFVYLEQFNASSIDIMVVCFTKTTEPVAYFEARQRLAFEVMRILDHHGVNFAFPSLSVYMEKNAPPTLPTTN